MKQSGFDGVVVGLIVVLLAGPRPDGCAAPRSSWPGWPPRLAASVLHGIATGWSAYWTALVGYQLSAIGGAGSNAGTRWTDFARHAGDVALDLTLVVIVAAVGWRLLDRPGRWVTGGWLLAGFVGINLGGSYWPHYFVQPLPVLVLLAAVAVLAVRRVRWRAALGAVLVLPTLVWLVALVPMSPRPAGGHHPVRCVGGARRPDRGGDPGVHRAVRPDLRAGVGGVPVLRGAAGVAVSVPVG